MIDFSHVRIAMYTYRYHFGYLNVQVNQVQPFVIICVVLSYIVMYHEPFVCWVCTYIITTLNLCIYKLHMRSYYKIKYIAMYTHNYIRYSPQAHVCEVYGPTDER